MTEANVWYRYKSYSKKRPSCYNGVIRLDNSHSVHMMVHFGELVQIDIVEYLIDDEKLYKNTDIDMIKTVNKVMMPIIAKKLLIKDRLNGIYSIKSGKVQKEWK